MTKNVINLEYLRSITSSASEGPWKSSRFVEDQNFIYGRMPGTLDKWKDVVTSCGCCPPHIKDNDAKFITTFNPAQVKILLDYIEDLESEVASEGRRHYEDIIKDLAETKINITCAIDGCNNKLGVCSLYLQGYENIEVCSKQCLKKVKKQRNRNDNRY